MKKTVFMLAAALALSGCAGVGYVQIMPRDSGKVYSGTVQGSGGRGTMTIDIDGQTYTGPVVRTGSDDSFGFVQQYGKGGMSTGTVGSFGGTDTVKAILSSPTGRGLRCEFTSTGSSGGGVCVNDLGRVFDAIVGR